MYGSKTKETQLEPGLVNARLVAFDIVAVNTDKYQGPALDIIWMVNDTKFSVRKFPVSKLKIAADISRNPARYTKKDGTLKVIDQVYSESIDSLNRYVKHVITGFVTKEVYEAKIEEWHKEGKFVEGQFEPTFDQFITVLKSMLPENYKEVEGQLKIGYSKNDRYLSVPDDMYKTGDFWSTPLNPKEIKTGDTKFFKMQPWGENLPAVPEVASDTDNIDTLPVF